MCIYCHERASYGLFVWIASLCSVRVTLWMIQCRGQLVFSVIASHAHPQLKRMGFRREGYEKGYEKQCISEESHTDVSDL